MYTRLLTVGLVFALLTGCGNMKRAGDRIKVINDLKELGLAYMVYQDANQKPPKSYQELADHTKRMGHPFSPGVANLTVTWGTGMGGLCKDGASSEVVVAHGPITSEVAVLYANGATANLTKAEFDSAKKAKPLN